MQKYHLDRRSQESGSLRALVRLLYDDFRKRDVAAHFGAQGIQAAAHVVEDPGIPGSSLQEDEELSLYDEDPAENPEQDPEYSRLRQPAAQNLRMRGEAQSIENMRKEIESLKRREARKDQALTAGIEL